MQNKTNQEEFISLFDYLKKPAGADLGKQVYEAAVRLKEPISVKNLSFDYKSHNGEHKRKIMTYKRDFLETYFAIKGK